MTWVDGPMQSWFDIHEAIEAGAHELRSRAHALSPSDRDEVARFADDSAFFMDVLIVHSKGEDGIVFPMLRDAGINVPEGLTAQHHDELTSIYDIQTAAIELRFADADHDVELPLTRIRDGLDALVPDLIEHIHWEDEHLAAEVLRRLTADEQVAILSKIHADTPAWLAPRLLPWMITKISAEHRVSLMRSWIGTLPAADFERNAHLIHDGVDRAVWRQLAEDVPGLARAVSAE
ncbi:MAG: hemerythrin domain-containing protein [Actinomycetota bacterium]